MLSRILLWAGSIGIGVTSILLQPIAMAKSSIEVAGTARTATVAIAQANRRGFKSVASAVAKTKKGDFQGALADYNEIVKLNPKNANAYYNRGLLKATNLQDDQGALADYDRAIKLKPTDDAPYNNRGNLKADKLKDYQGALVDYNRAIELQPKNADAYYNRGVLKHTFLNDQAGAITDLKQAVKLSPKQGNAESNQATIDLLEEWQRATKN
jgi:tetratricopeptide (TPR) repeat protein